MPFRRVDNTNSDQLWPADLIEQATGIIVKRFGLDAAQGLEVLRRMSRNTMTQMCVVAEQIVNHDLPEDAVRSMKMCSVSAERP
jgi:AmiR/NasT family two-component response regulator